MTIGFGATPNQRVHQGTHDVDDVDDLDDVDDVDDDQRVHQGTTAPVRKPKVVQIANIP